MLIKNRKSYSIHIEGDYTVGQSEELAETLAALETTYTDLISLKLSMSASEQAILEESLGKLLRLISPITDDSAVPETSNQLPPTRKEQDQDSHDEESETGSASGADWDTFKMENPVAYLEMSEIPETLEAHLVAGLTHLLQSEINRNGRPRAVRQIHIAEAHLLLMDYLGIQWVEPKNEQNGFVRLVNDVHVLRILHRPSNHFLQEPIRGYRTAENNGKIAMAIKVPLELDPSKATDYFAFTPERGRVNAIRELRDIGVTQLDRFKELAFQLEDEFKEDVDALRRASDRAAAALVAQQN
ncbi:hypothetical protein GCM10008956_32290 [Deinococcus arenae]|uniref:Uncharacterized protein n=1 Tax=Deinococcus arenae TaxID=1452751 RepID=A0A8H9GRV7_9DEIO|nr:hypothetical protein [Deinococcus arenae]GGM53836.1 hypothetical protein GCM10008956_32290 [Deinococcus arenae]